MDPDVRADIPRLLQLARDGDSSQLGRLLQSYRSYLLLLARLNVGRQLQAHVDPSDLVQETFMEASRQFQRFRGATEPELLGWLRQIMATRIAGVARRVLGPGIQSMSLEKQLTDELDRSSCYLGTRLIAPQSSPSQHAAAREHAVLLAEALAGLPADYREVLVLRNLQGLTFPEVAQEMGRSLDSVKNLWTRALTRLRRTLGDLL